MECQSSPSSSYLHSTVSISVYIIVAFAFCCKFKNTVIIINDIVITLTITRLQLYNFGISKGNEKHGIIYLVRFVIFIFP